MPRLSDGSRRRRTLVLAGLWTAIVGGSCGAAIMTHTKSDPALDKVSLCKRDASLEGSSMIVVDTTDALNDVHRRRLKVAIEAERDATPVGGRLTLAAINAAKPGEPIELVSVCNPGRAADFNRLFVTASHAEKRWRDAFEHPIHEAIAAAASGNAAASSPIIQSIAAVLTRPDFDARVRNRRLVLSSDLLQHEKGGYSQLAHGDLWKMYQGSALARDIQLDLRGVAVAIDYLPRPQYRTFQGARHLAFWKRLFTEAGAADVAFIGLREPEPVLRTIQSTAGNKRPPMIGTARNDRSASAVAQTGGCNPLRRRMNEARTHCPGRVATECSRTDRTCDAR